MKRTTIWLDESTRRKLAKIAVQEQRSVAFIVRRELKKFADKKVK